MNQTETYCYDVRTPYFIKPYGRRDFEEVFNINITERGGDYFTISGSPLHVIQVVNYISDLLELDPQAELDTIYIR